MRKYASPALYIAPGVNPLANDDFLDQKGPIFEPNLEETVWLIDIAG